MHRSRSRSRRSAALVAGVLVALTAGCRVSDVDRTIGAPLRAGPERDPWRQPFPWDSIWNVPLGTLVAAVPAGLEAEGARFLPDEDVLLGDPTAPVVDLWRTDAGWDPTRTRCGSMTTLGGTLGQIRVPTGFSTDPGYLGRTPNQAAALLRPDGRTVLETQPFHRCGPDGPAVSAYVWGVVDPRLDDGIVGAHGGSGMSALGGTIRLGEWVPGGRIAHAVKIELDCARWCAFDPADPTPGYRWPARKADDGAASRYGGTTAALQMGALVALPTGFDVVGLRTEAARVLAAALRDYGAYLVDDTAGPTVAVAVEWGDRGRVTDEFAAAWGFPLDDGRAIGCGDGSARCAFLTDIGDIVAALVVIDANGPGRIGGEGPRRAACAGPFADGTGGAPLGCGLAGVAGR